MPTPPTDTPDSGFLSRWSRRKTQQSQGVDEARPAPVVDAAVDAAVVPVLEVPTTAEAPHVPMAPAAAAEKTPPPPTLADVAALTRDSDYSRFVVRGVQPEVKNAALSKLFADPHFNVMDGLDTYIDDYGKPDPLPEGMLRQMLQAHVLGLFDHEKEQPQESAEPPAINTAAPTDQTPPPDATAAPDTDTPANTPADTPAQTHADENTDLQLQPDDGAGRPGAATGVEQDAGRAR
jgi:Protein of unknown function (DUF3306)